MMPAHSTGEQWLSQRVLLELQKTKGAGEVLKEAQNVLDRSW